MISFCAAISVSIWVRRGARAHRLALRLHELLVERLHLEEEHVAASLARPLAARHIAGASVVGDHVTGLHAQILGREQMRADARDVRPRDLREGHRLRGAAGHAVDQIELRDPVVVVRPRLDRDFLSGVMP